MSAGANFKELQDGTTANLISITRAVHQLEAEDIGFHRSLDPAVSSKIDKQNARLLRTAQRLAHATVGSKPKERVMLKDTEQIDENWSGVVDVIDSLLERASTALDEYRGIIKRGGWAESTDTTPKERESKRRKVPQDESLPFCNDAEIFKTEIPRPQDHFEIVPRNDFTDPFKPLLTSKPHAMSPLTQSLRKIADEKERAHWTHPYQQEIEHYNYPATVHTQAEPIPYAPLKETVATLVEDEEGLDKMIEELKNAEEIAIDLEHHDVHTYIGLACLMQISTRDKDWIVDTLKPWRHKLERLNEVFADPKILKVLHGSHSDMIWLQRDFGIYVVGLFDTYHASRALNYSSGGLAYLLQTFANFSANKKYQRADWRIRPLPQTLVEYAQADTHFLLFIYDSMRNELISKSTPGNDLLANVLRASKEEALQRYEHPFYDFEHGSGTGGWYKLLLRPGYNFSKEQFSVFRAIHKWRDTVAREQDESTAFLMPVTKLMALAQLMPTKKQDLSRMLAETTYAVCADLQPYLNDLLNIVIKAKEDGTNGPEVMEVLAQSNEINIRSKKTTKSQDTRPLTEASQNEMGKDQAGLLSTPESQAQHLNLNNCPLSAEKSTFWGGVIGWNQQKKTFAPEPKFVLPLPELMSEVSTPSLPREVVASKKRKAEIAELDKNDGTSAIPSLFQTRSATNDDSPKNRHVETTENSSGADTPTKEERRKRRKEEKKLKKALEEQQRAAQEANYEPFDYTAAPSVLNAPRTEDARSQHVLDPYKKALDAPKGLPKRQREMAGKSATWSG